MKNFFLAALACLAVLVSQNGLEAQISWSPAVNTFAGGDNSNFISQRGDFVLGINPGGPDVTIGTAVFSNAGGLVNADMLSAAGGVTSTQNGVTYTGDFDNVQQAPTFGGGQFVEATDVIDLLSSANWNYTYDPATPDTVTLSGLTEGNVYELQVLVSDGRGGTGGGVRDERWVAAFTNGVNDLVAVTAQLAPRPFNEGDSPAAAGDFVIGEFTADATGTVAFSMSATRGNSFALDPADPANTQEEIERDQFVVGESIDIAANTPAGGPSGGQTQINALQLRDITNFMPGGGVCGDVNLDGSINFLDIAPFISVLSSGNFQAEADCNEDGMVSFLDISPFITELASQ